MLLLSINAAASQNVLTRKIGPETMYVFPSSGITERSGEISIGKTILIVYAIKISGGKTRFISLDAAQLTSKSLHGFKPIQAPEKTGSYLGFYIRDTTNKVLDIFINPDFTNKFNKLESNQIQRIARFGNLNVIIGAGKSRMSFKIIKVEIN